MEGKRMTFREKAGYGVCDLGGNLFFTAIGLWLFIYLTDTVGIEPLRAGIIVAIGKIWDAVTDPVIGYFSDRTKSRWGRRRPYILFGSIPLFLTMFIMFTDPKIILGIESDQAFLFIWGVLAFCLLNTAYTVVNIPYSSLTPELTQDFHERTVLNGYRFGFAVIGTLLGAGLALPIVDSFPDKSIGFSVMGVFFGAVMMITAMATFFSVREPDIVRPKLTKGFFESYLHVFKNKPYVLILMAYAIHITALTVVMSVAAYYFKYIHQDEPMTTAAMLILLVTAMIFIPVSVIDSKKAGKKFTYGFGLFIFAVSLVILFFFGHVLDPVFSLGMMLIAGIGMGFTYVMPYAMVPDAIEYDYLLTGERTEGAFYAIWTFMLKIGQAVALAITGTVLWLTNYQENIVPQPEASAELGIRLLLGVIPAIIFFIGIIVLSFYPINEERYNEILAGIKEMEAKRDK